jgi:hypothetical protein
MATRDYCAAEFNKILTADEEASAAEDHSGTYVLPFFASGATASGKIREALGAQVFQLHGAKQRNANCKSQYVGSC